MSLTGIYDVTYEGDICGSLHVSQEGIRTTFSLTANGCDGVTRLLCACGGKYVPIGIPAPDDNVLTLKRSFSKNALAEKGLSSIEGCILLPIGEETPKPPQEAADAAPAAPEPEEAAPHDEAFEVGQNIELEAAREPVEDAVSCEDTAEEDDTQNEGAFENEPLPGWRLEPAPWRLFSEEHFSDQCLGITGAMAYQDGDKTLLALPFSPSEPFPLISAFQLGRITRLGDREYVVFRLENGVPV